MKKILISLVIGLLAGMIIAAFLFVKFQPRPGPATQGEKIVYKDRIITGQMSGSTVIKPKIDQEGRDKVSTSKPSTDFKTAVPVAGKIETKQTTIEFTGITNVERTGDKLTVDTVFNPDVTETVKQDKVKTWHVGAYVMTDFDVIGIGGHVQKDFALWRNLVAFGRVEADREVRLKAGIEYSF
jgi:hypothetical protein